MEEEHFTNALNRLIQGNETEVKLQDICFDKSGTLFFEDVIHSKINYGDPILVYKLQELNGSSVTPCRNDIQNSITENGISEYGFDKVFDEEEQNNMGGSPLKLQQFDMECPLVRGLSTTNTGITNDQISRIKGQPLDVTLARHLLSMYTLTTDLRPDNCISSLWTFCDAKDHEGTVILASYTQKANCAKESEDLGNINSRTYKVTSRGPYTNKGQFPKLTNIIKKHFPQNAKVKTKCFAEYDMFGSLSRDVSMLQTPASLQIKLEWEKTSVLLQTPPLDAKATVEATVTEGDMRSAAYYMYTELHTLKGFTHGIKEAVVEWSVENEDQSVITTLKALLDDLKQGDYGRRMSVKPEENEPQSPLKNLVLVSRKDLDFTEQLWNIFKECTCYKDLVEGLELVLTYLHKGVLQPMVHKSNKSRMAQLVRDSYYGEMVLPSMEGVLPLQILVEIGTEKLQRDYTNALIGKDLVTASHLEYFLKTGESYEEKLERLEKLHSALEVAVMLEQYLNLPRPTLSLSARQALKYYENNPVEESHTFSVPVQTNTIANAIDRCHASLWKVELQGSSDQHQSMCASYILTTRPLFNTIYKEMTNQESEVEEDALHYYMTTESENVIVL